MPRVLMTLDAVGGVWSYALDTAATLARHGHQLRLLGFGPPPATFPPGIDMHWADAPLDWMVEDEAGLAQVAPTIAAHIRTWRPDIVHLAAPTQAAKLPPGPALVVQSHSCVPTWWEATRGTALRPTWHWHLHRNRAGIQRADVLAVPSVSHGHALARLYGPIPHLRVVPNALTPTPRSSTARQGYVFAAARWWDEGKNARTLDDAAAQTPWPILMAGPLEGPNQARTTLRHALRLGELPRAEVGAHMAAAAIFAAPSHYEPFGLAVLEAANAGACLLLADIPTFRELWHGAATFAPPNDPSAWAQAIATLAADPARRTALGAQARLRAATFSPRRLHDALLATYDAALAATTIAA